MLRLRGNVDLERTLGIRAEMQHAVESGARVVRLDVSETAFLDCAGLDALLWCVRRGRRAGVRVELSRPSRAVSRLLAVTRTQGCFPVAA